MAIAIGVISTGDTRRGLRFTLEASGLELPRLRDRLRLRHGSVPRAGGAACKIQIENLL